MFSFKTAVVSFVGVTACAGVFACSAEPIEGVGESSQRITDAPAVAACLSQDARRGPGAACDFTIQCGPGMVCQASEATQFKLACTYAAPTGPAVQRGAGESCDERYVDSKCAYGLSCGSNSATSQYEAARGRVAPGKCQSACIAAPCSTNADCAPGGTSLYCARTTPAGGEYAVPFCDYKPAAAAPPATAPATGPADACAALNNATYCGQSTYFRSGDKNTLYTCAGHKIAATQVCASGCEAFPDERLDVCKQCVRANNSERCSATVTASCYERSECTPAKEYYDVWKDSCGVSYKTRVAAADTTCK